MNASQDPRGKRKRKPAKPRVQPAQPAVASAAESLQTMQARRGWDLDDVCERIAAGETYTAIAADYGKHHGALSMWLAAQPDRSARAREAASMAGRFWDEAAEAGIRAASDVLSLAKARELAQHLRWRASKLSPAYADRSKVEVGGAVGVFDAAQALTPEQLQRVAQAVLEGLPQDGASGDGGGA